MDDDAILQFLAETWEDLPRVDAAISALEQEPDNREILAGIFRAIHTLKGACSALGLARIGQTAHIVENALARLRNGSVAVDSASIAFLSAGIESIKDALDGLEATGEETDVDLTSLIRQSEQLIEQEDPVTVAPVACALRSAKRKHGVNSLEPQLDPQRMSELSESIPHFVRINAGLLDGFTQSVAELSLTRDELRQLVPQNDNSPFAEPIARLDRITADLEDLTERSRKQPIGQAWSQLPRLVRELSCITGKPLQLETHGAETELDRTFLAAIRNSLTQLVRNAADHGIEPSAERQSLGKPESGRVAISAVPETDAVILCVEDDGAGINRQRVIQRALELGLIAEEAAWQLPDDEITRLIMQPGFSTAEAVTSLSGRGVGLDVVRTEIARIGGTVTVSSEPGRGTSIRMQIPLSTAACASQTPEPTTLLRSVANARNMSSGEAASAEQPSLVLQDSTTAPRALVIDDSRFFRQLLRAALESEGYRLTVVDAAERAVELLDRHAGFDVILCDIEMPGMDGCQFAAWRSTKPELRSIPLVAITSLDAETHGERILSAGFDKLLIKFNPQQLRDTLAEIVPWPIRSDAKISA